MSLIDILADAQGGRCFANLARRFQVTPDSVRKCAEATRPVVTRQIADLLQSDDGIETFLATLADPAVMAINFNPGALADPLVRQAGEALCRELARHDISSCDVIADIARQSHLGHRSVRTLLPFLTLLFVGAIRTHAEPAFRRLLTKHQPDDAVTDPFEFANDHAVRVRLERAAPPRAGGWLDLILSGTVPAHDRLDAPAERSLYVSI